MIAVATLVQREIVRFLRQRSRVVGALGTPLVFWFLIGSGLGNSFRSPGMVNGGAGLDYLRYFFPGTVALILLFTAIFSTISIIEDRREGFLQAVLVAPVPRSTIVLGKLFGGTILAAGQGLVFVAIAPILGVTLTLARGLYLVGVMTTVAFALTGLGFVIAWRMNSTQGFHAIMNLFLIPLWLMSGSLFPIGGAASWLGLLMRLNPLSYGVQALHYGLFGNAAAAGLPSAGACALVSVVFAAVMFGLSVWVAAQPEK